MRIGIYGAGSLGTVLGAYLSRGGQEVELINRNAKHVAALNQNGARITGTVNMTVPVRAITPDLMQGKYDILFLMTKQQQNAEVVTSLLPFLCEDSVICTMQNGLPEPGIAAIAGEERVLGCAVAWGAQMVSPGVCELTSEPDSLSFSLGSFGGSTEGKLMEVKRILELMCPAVVEENFMGVRWSKLLINAAFSGPSAAFGCTFGEAANNKESRRVVQKLIKECIDVAKASGIRVEPVQGKDIVKLLDYNGAFKRMISFMIIPIAIKKHAAIRASMLQDIENGKKSEIDAINGAVCAQGRRTGVKTPANDKIVEIIHLIEDKKLAPDFENLRLFSEL